MVIMYIGLYMSRFFPNVNYLPHGRPLSLSEFTSPHPVIHDDLYAAMTSTNLSHKFINMSWEIKTLSRFNPRTKNSAPSTLFTHNYMPQS